MGQGQGLSLAGLVRAVNEVDIDGPGTPFFMAYPPQLPLNGKTAFEKIRTGKTCLHSDSAVDKRRLIFLAPRRRFVKRRHSCNRHVRIRIEESHGSFQRPFPIPQIAPMLR